MKSKIDDNSQYSERETARRRDAVIKQMLATPPKPHSEMKINKGKPSKRTAGKGRARVGKART